jgi:hypothetical protein
MEVHQIKKHRFKIELMKFKKHMKNKLDNYNFKLKKLKRTKEKM